MTTEQGMQVLTLLQTFWPIDWNPKMSRRHETVAVDELRRCFKDYDVEIVLEAIRSLAQVLDKPAKLPEIIDRANALEGRKASTADYTLEQYIINFPKPGEPWPIAEDGYEVQPKWVYVRKYKDGRVAGPPGVKLDRQQLIWQHLIKPDDVEYKNKPGTAESVQETIKGFRLVKDVDFGEKL